MENGFTGRWQNVISSGTFLLSVLGGFWILAYQPIARELERLNEVSQSFVERREYDEYKGRIDANHVRFQNDINALKESIVPRGEHQEKWRSNDLAIANVQRQIDEIRRDFGASYTLNDKIKELQRQIEQLQREKLNANLGPATRSP